MPPEQKQTDAAVVSANNVFSCKNLSTAVILALVTLAVYWPVRQFHFLSYDDAIYVTDNHDVMNGLTTSGMSAAFGFHANNWHPLTWLTHMLDAQIYGRSAGGHHFTNALFHAANAGLLFLLLARLTSSFWPSFFVAAIFAWHPLRVESVAWVAERKDVLSGFFFILTVWAYARFAERREQDLATEARATMSGSTWLAYSLSLGAFILALMSKSMVVTLPCVLLLLDFWPLNRVVDLKSRDSSSSIAKFTLQISTLRRLLIEKIPFFILSAITSFLTVKAQGAAIVSTRYVPITSRFANAIVSYQRYVRKTFWPSDLGLIYLQPEAWPAMDVLISIGLLVALTGIAVYFWRRSPWLTVGWLWFVGVLFPVIGLTQAGAQAMADRFSYLPQIGLAIAFVWGVSMVLPKSKPAAIGLLGAALLLACGAATRQQLMFWHDGVTIFNRSIGVDPKNYLAYSYLGNEYRLRGDLSKAKQFYRAAIEINPKYVRAHDHLVDVLEALGDHEGAMNEFRSAIHAALAWEPKNVVAWKSLGDLAVQQGKTEEAIEAYQKALQFDPACGEAHRELGVIFLKVGKQQEALSHCAEAARLMATNSEAQFQFGRALALNGKSVEAIEQLKGIVAKDPDHTNALNQLAWILSTDADPKIRNADIALQLAQRACNLTQYRLPEYLDTLAAAEAEAGNFDNAVNAIKQFKSAARAMGEIGLPEDVEKRLALYQQKQPYHAPK